MCVYGKDTTHCCNVVAYGCLFLQMADGATELQDAVARLCCLWWQKELPGRAHMVPQMIPYLLYQATVSGSSSMHCYAANVVILVPSSKHLWVSGSCYAYHQDHQCCI